MGKVSAANTQPNAIDLKQADARGRNEPCPCGSGLKYKKWVACAKQEEPDELSVLLFARTDQGIHLCHFVKAPSHRSFDLILKATRGVTIAVVSPRQRKRRQPGLATDDPAFVGWHQLVRGIQGS
jgi:hypothetical protein